MTRDELEHLIRAAGTILNEDGLIIVGSQSILAQNSESLPPEAVYSCEADFLPLDDPDGHKADLIDGTIGEGSPFHEAFGVYAQGVGPQTSRLPRGWRERLVPLVTANTRGVTAYCLEPHDLLVAKYLANREKYRVFCRAIVKAGLADRNVLLARLSDTDCTTVERDRVTEAIARDFMPDNPDHSS